MVRQTSTLLLLFTLLTFKAFSQNPFVTTWKTDNPGTSCTTCIEIPTNPNYSYNYDVDWDNDGVYDDLGVTGNITHDYGTVGIVDVAIRGNFPAIYTNNEKDKSKIIDIKQWLSLIHI